MSLQTTGLLKLNVCSHLKMIKFHFIGSSDKQNLTLEVISYEIYGTRRRLNSYEMTTCVRSSISNRIILNFIIFK